MQKYLVVGTDGSKYQIFGLYLLIYNLLKHNSDLFNSWNILIFHSQSINSSELDFLRLNQNCELKPIKLKKTKDKYYAKFMLKKFVDKIKSENAVVLYLDYDHYCRKSLLLPKINKDSIYVSSEIKSLSSIINLKYLDNSEFSVINYIHYNTSLIYGNSQTLKKAMRYWEFYYTKFSGIISYRYLEEIAFSLSAFHEGLKLLPVSLELQSSFYESTQNCSLFHYGGEYWISKYIKDFLNTVYPIFIQKDSIEKKKSPEKWLNIAMEIFQLTKECFYTKK